jgi:hypothetical protein
MKRPVPAETFKISGKRSSHPSTVTSRCRSRRSIVPDPKVMGETAARSVPHFSSALESSSVSFRVAPPGGGPRGVFVSVWPGWMMMRFVPRS